MQMDKTLKAGCSPMLVRISCGRARHSGSEAEKFLAPSITGGLDRTHGPVVSSCLRTAAGSCIAV